MRTSEQDSDSPSEDVTKVNNAECNGLLPSVMYKGSLAISHTCSRRYGPRRGAKTLGHGQSAAKAKGCGRATAHDVLKAALRLLSWLSCCSCTGKD